jgi:23S rRNA pseudouridine1911/1915/1917 synthase
MSDQNQLSEVANNTWRIEPEQVGERLDRFLVAQLQDLSRTGVQQLIAEDAVLINGKPSKPGYALRLHDDIQVLRATPAGRPSSLVPQDLPLTVVYEDADMLVINKAAGMVVHPAPGHYDDTLVNALLALYPQLQESKENLRPGIVHRLDKDTSGLLIVAKNVQMQAALIDQMKEHKITKRYLVLVEGTVSLDNGSIDAPIARDPRNRHLMAIMVAGGREARTHFRVQERFARHTLLLVQLETGRTHQIRVHLKAIGHPVAADPTYGSGRKLNGITLQRQFLHAYQLELDHPISGVHLKLEAPLPADLQAVLDRPEIL